MSDAPKTVHRYEIVERLGQGGMGDLYLGRDPMLDRFVAIKMLRAGSTADDLRERFAREARSAARLAHINIVTIYDVGEHEGQPYIAMEYVLGETLLEKIRRRSDLPLATKLQYVDELCAGLAHAHRAGIIHRDIKPANLIVAADGPLKILDFGIARLADSSMTQSGMMLGTLNYMSPEQISGPEVDTRSDIFAVGAVFYELLSYQQAFPGAIDTVLSRILFGTPTPLTQLCPGLDASIIGIVEKALAKAAADRFEDLTAMRTELARTRDRLDRKVLDAPVTTSRLSSGKIPIAVPTPGHKTPRRGTTREEIKRRRAEEVAGHLAAARNAFAAGKFEEASAACERALIIEQDNEEALDLSERARAAIEQNQIRQWAVEARREIDEGNLGAAQNLLSSIVALDAESPEARGLRTAIAQLESRRSADKVVGDGRRFLESGDAAGAAAAAREAMRVNPTHAGAASLLRDASVLVETQRRKAEHDRQARDAIASARRAFDSGAHDAAIAALEQFAPPHAEVDATLDQLRGERQSLEEREFALTQQAAAEIVIAQAWLARDDLSEAAAAIDRARAIAPAHPGLEDVVAAIEARHAEIDARRRQDEEARRQAELSRLKAEEEARRKAEDEARRRRAEEDARRKKADDERRRAEEEAARREAEEDERRRAEEARRAEQEARRAEQEARRKAEDDAKQKALEEKRLKTEAEARRRAEEENRRRAEAEAARRAAAEESTEQADRPERRLSNLKEAKQKDEERKRMAPARSAADAEPLPGELTPAALPPAPLPLMTPSAAPKSGSGAKQIAPVAAAAAVLLALIGFGIWQFAGGDDPPRVSTPATPTPAPTSPQPAAPPSPQPPPAAPAPAPTIAEAPPAVAPTAPAAPSTTATPPSVPVDAIRTINALVQRDQLPQALAAAEKVIPIAPADPQLVQALTSLQRRAQETALRTKDEAAKLGGEKSAESSFREGAQAEADAATRARGGDRVGSIRALLSAAQMFGKAVNEARAINEKNAADETARRQREAEDKRLADLKAREQADALAKQQDFERRQKEQQARVDPPVPKPLPGPPPGTAPGAAPSMTQAQEEEGVRAALRAYEAAYEALDVNAVMRINPRVSGEKLAAVFKQYRSYEMEIDVQQITFGPARMRAFVTARVTIAFQPLSGRRMENTRPQQFVLQREGNAWRIEGIK